MTVQRPRGSAYVNDHSHAGPIRVKADVTGPPKDPYGDMRECIEIANKSIWPRIQPYLVNRQPEVQAGILASVASLWVIAYPEAENEAMLRTYSDLLGRMVALHRKIIDGQVELH